MNPRFAASALVPLLLLHPRPGQACSGFLVKGSPDAVVGKNLDWPHGQGLIFVNKRDTRKEAIFVGHPAAWTSTQLSVTFSQKGREFPWEGMNESGLSVDILEFRGSEVPAANDSRPAINGAQWVQYILDTSANLEEAIRSARSIRLSRATPYEHYLVCDASASCALFEYLNGVLTVRAGSSFPYPAITNNSYPASLRYLSGLLAQEDPATLLAGTSQQSLDRFARAALWSRSYDAAEDAVSYAFQGLRNVAQNHGTGGTQWSLVYSLQPRTIHYSTRQAPQVRSINLHGFDPGCSSGAMMLDVNSADAGDVTALFKPYSSAANDALVDDPSSGIPEARREILKAYPDSHTRCLE